MTDSNPAPAPQRARITPAGLMFLAITSVGWGFNWPVTKYLIGELPPFTLRGLSGVVGALLLAFLALARGQSLYVPRKMWGRLVLAAVLNVSGWMVLMGAGVTLAAGEQGGADRLHYAGLGLPDRLAGARRAADAAALALVMAFAGLAAIMGGNGIAASEAKLPGIIMALIGFAVGTLLSKRWPLRLPPIPGAPPGRLGSAACRSPSWALRSRPHIGAP